MKLRTSEYFVRETFLSLKRNTWMTFASIGTVSVALFVFGMFLLIVMNMNKMASVLESRVEISVYLKDELRIERIRSLDQEIKEIAGVESVLFIPKDEAIAEFRERLGEQAYLLNALGNKNPLPNAFRVKMKRPEIVKESADKITVMDGVEAVKYGQDVIEHLFEITKLVRIIGLSIMFVLAAATLFIISNTIRLTVFARRKEVAIMKYVGATDWFIRWPFMLEGILLGLFGGILSSVFLRFAYGAVENIISESLAFFPLIPTQPFLTYITLVVILAGIIMGALGSTISLKRFLKA